MRAASVPAARLQAHSHHRHGGRGAAPLIPGAELASPLTASSSSASARARRGGGSSYIAIELAGIFAASGPTPPLVLRGTRR